MFKDNSEFRFPNSELEWRSVTAIFTFYFIGMAKRHRNFYILLFTCAKHCSLTAVS